MIDVIPFAAMVAALLLGVPIAVALAGSGVLGIWLVKEEWGIVLGVLKTATLAAADYNLSTVPMFILLAYFSSTSGLAEELYTAASRWLSHLRGGLAIATIFACAVFGALCGGSVAASAVMSKIAYPNMRRLGYSDVLSVGVVGVGSTIVILIPPSVPMVIYGIVTETSIGKLLIAGVFPGILLGICLILCILIWVTLDPSHAPQAQAATWAERWGSLRGIWPSITLIIVILVVLYSGIATPTEAGAVGAAAAAVIGIALKRLTWKGFLKAVVDTVGASTMIFMIVIGATIFGSYMTMSRIPQDLAAAVTAMQINPWVIIIAITVGYFIISMFMDEIPLLILTLPVTFPLVTKIGFDPIWFGVLSVLMVCMGLVFPPVGLVAFVVSATTKVDLVTVYRGTSILICGIFLTYIFVMIFPKIATWLPATMR
ncbi:MAG: TRAP transporter large permease [Thermodesulfobacteriota bacterium]